MSLSDARIAEVCEDAYLTKKEAEDKGYVFISDGDTDAQAVVALEKDTLLFAFAGSDSLTDYKFNLDFLKREEGIHPGFRDVFLSLHYDVARLIRVNQQANPAINIAFAGHSSGGAVAILAYSSFYRRLRECRAITFGCPRVYGRESKGMSYSIGYNLKESNITRYEHPRDPIVSVPPKILGYRHVGKTIKLELLQPDPEGGNWFSKLFKKLPSRHSMKRYAKNTKGRT
jgi:hypothetical protein